MLDTYTSGMFGTGWKTLLALFAVAASAGCDIGREERVRGLVPRAQPGDTALDYVTAQPYGSMIVEVDYIAGHPPSAEALGKMREIFAQRLSKPLGVEWIVDDEIPESAARSRWQVGDILALESQFRDYQTSGNQAVMWIGYLNGESEFDEGTTRALGIAYDASSVAIFRDNITRTSHPDVQEIVEAMVLVHEGGHLFGLVNNGLPMVNNHEDGANPRHDVNPECVMHHRIETSDVQKLLTSPAMDFDYECRLDISFAGGPGPGEREGSTVIIPTAPSESPRRPSGPILSTADGIECRAH
jgi:hypothetical protein